MSFSRGFGLAFGGIAGKFFGVLALLGFLCAVIYLLGPKVTSAFPWVLAGLGMLVAVGYLLVSGFLSEDTTLKRRKIIAAVLLVCWTVLWLRHTTFS